MKNAISVSVVALMLAAAAPRADAQPTGDPGNNVNNVRPWACWAMSAGGPAFHDARVTSGCGVSDDPAPPVSPRTISPGVAGAPAAPIRAAATPAAPTALHARVSRRRVILTWTPPAGSAPDSYVFEAGSGRALSNLANVNTRSARPMLVATHVSAGSYAMRVRAVTAAATSAPSNDVLFTVGTPATCTSAPGAPSGLTRTTTGLSVTLSWTASSGSPTSYVLLAGSAPGTSNLATVDTGNTNTTFTASAGAGTYYVRVAGRNACGDSAASNEVIVVLSSTCTLPSVPTGLRSTVNGSTVTVAWNSTSGATSYTLLAGSSSGTSNLAVVPQTPTTLTAPGIGNGTFFLRVTASNSCGTSAASNEIVMVVGGGTWQTLRNTAPAFMSTPLLLTDGTVFAVALSGPSATAWRLTPDNTGSYVNGTWSLLTAFPSGYSPLYFASAVLADGRVVITGGEYNGSSTAVETTLGYVYNPLANAWTSLAPPSGWARVGDAPATVLADGRFLLGYISGTQTALLDPSTLAWTAAGNRIASSGEVGYALLPDQSVFSVDTVGSSAGRTERYLPSSDSWVAGATSPVALVDTASAEIGAQVLRPDGTVFVAGGTGHTAVYTPPASATGAGAWTVGPDFPTSVTGQLDAADGPAVLLPSGNVLLNASPGVFHAPTYYYEFDGTRLFNTNQPVFASFYPSFSARLLMLPTGQVLHMDGNTTTSVYTPLGSPNPAWAPRITTAPSAVTRGQTYQISGTQFNGMSQAVGYGDDYQAATNYPLVRITNRATGHVFYARTHDHSTMGVATGTTTVSTSFEVPGGTEAGAADLVVVTNGIPSASVAIVVS